MSTVPDPSFLLLLGGLTWAGVLTYHELRTRPESALTPQIMLETLTKITLQPPALPTLTLGTPDWYVTYPNEDDQHVFTLELQIGLGMTTTPNSVKTVRLDVGEEISFYPLDPPRGESAQRRGRLRENVLDRKWIEFPVDRDAYGSEWGWVEFGLTSGGAHMTAGTLRATLVRIVAITANAQEVTEPLEAPAKAVPRL